MLSWHFLIRHHINFPLSDSEGGDNKSDMLFFCLPAEECKAFTCVGVGCDKPFFLPKHSLQRQLRSSSLFHYIFRMFMFTNLFPKNDQIINGTITVQRSSERKNKDSKVSKASILSKTSILKNSFFFSYLKEYEKSFLAFDLVPGFKCRLTSAKSLQREQSFL